jgi:myo-inositol-1(or 4)-monophosphatase
MDNLLEDVVEITRDAGAAILQFYRSSFDVRDKKPDNPVTDADLAADQLLKRRLMARLPEAGWLSEETVDDKTRLDKQLVWVVDPLDGTKEFVMGMPEFSISVALVQEGQPILGVIYNPPTGEMFSVLKGKGFALNDKPVAVSSCAALSGARVDASRSERKRGEFEPFEQMVRLKTMGSIAYKLARVAAGLTDATWSRGPKNEWDICAGTLMVCEAGGQCVDLDDQVFTYNRAQTLVNGIIADNGLLHDQVLAALAPHRETART